MPNSQVRVNVLNLVNNRTIRKERRNGRDKIIVPSATLPDNVVMNDIRYLPEEIEGDPSDGTGYRTLNNTPAPLGHPSIEGMFVSASDPEGINIGWIGAHNENARRENGRVYLDKVIDVARAKESEGGRAVLDAIEKGDPIHTSTGLIGNIEDADDDPDAKYIMRNMVFDHDAILLGEQGAATPEQGVGMMVNSKGDQIKVINSTCIEDEADRDIEWAADIALRAAERLERAPLVERIKTAIKGAISGALNDDGSDQSASERKDAEMADDKKVDALTEQVNALQTTVDGIKDVFTSVVNDALKPLVDAQKELKANQDAKDKAELDGYVEIIVKNNLLDEADAKELTLNAARALAKKAGTPGKAAPVNGSFTNKSEDGNGFRLPGSDKKGEAA